MTSTDEIPIRPPFWLYLAAAATVAGVGLHTRVYDDWVVYEALLIGGFVLTGIGLLVWFRRTLHRDQPTLPILIVGAWLGLIGAYVGAGSTVYYMLAAAACTLVLPLCLVLAGLHALRGRKGPRNVLLAAAAACLLQAGAALASDVIRQHDVAAARSWCEGLVPAISRYRKSRGFWPIDPDTDQLAPTSRPRRLRGARYYELDRERKEFRLFVSDRSSWLKSDGLQPIRWWWSPSTERWLLKRE